MEIAGIHPMLYAFFDADGALRRDGFIRQAAAAEASGAAGVAVLGLGTEVHKLGRDERERAVEWTLGATGGRLPVAVTIAGGPEPDMIDAARRAEAAGADWLLLQPPPPPCPGPDLVAHVSAVAGAVGCPVAIQNAPEFLGLGLTVDEIAALGRASPNVVAVKAECSAVAAGDLVDALGGRLAVLNGRAGLELTDNLRAGVAGMIPGIETADHQVACARAMAAGDEAEAEAVYRSILPTLAFIMQGLAQFTTYGKLIAAARLGIEPGPMRRPALEPTARGEAWAERLARELGPLPH